jgi:3-oxoacyl-[acyl-carrier-protein] synthase-1
VRQAAARRWGAARVGVFLGTSTSGILQTEVAYRHRDPATGALPAWLHYAQTHNTYSVVALRARRAGPAGAGLCGVHRLLVQRQGVCRRGNA